MILTIAALLYALVEALDLDTTGARGLSYDIPSGTLSVCNESGVVIASGTDVADVWGQLHP